MTRAFRLPCLAACLAAGLVAAPPELVARLKADVTALAGPDFKGRGDGQEGLEKAAKYAVASFQKMGLKAELQRVPFQVLKRDRLEAKVTQGKEARLLVAGRDIDLFDGKAELKLEAKPLLFIGQGLAVPEHDDLAGLDLKGRVVVVDARPTEAVRKKVPQEAWNPEARFKTLADRGVSLVLFAVPMEGQGHLGSMGFEAPLPTGLLYKNALQGPAAEALAEALKRAGEGTPGGRELPVTLDLVAKQGMVDTPLPNVIVSVPGTDPVLKAEHVVVGAHLDHMGATPGEGGKETVLYGADDNASGCSAVLEIARQIVKQPTRRSTTFILFGGEEQGLLGSAHWVKQPTVPIAQVKSMVNLDCIGRFDPKGQDLGLTGLGYAPDALAHARSLAPASLKVTTDRGTTQFAYMSDHASFAKAKIPAVFFFTGIHADLHKPTDTAEKLNFEAMGDITEFALRLTRDQADSPTAMAYEPRPSLGFQPESPTALKVARVTPGGLAATLKLQAGDVVVAVAGKPVASVDELRKTLDTLRVGEPVEVRWNRDGKEIQATGPLGAAGGF